MKSHFKNNNTIKLAFNQLFTRNSLKQDFFHISLILIIGILTILIFITFYTYFNEKKFLEKKVILSTNKVEQIINESFDYTESIATFIGKEILKIGTTNVKNIADLISGKVITNQMAKDIFSFTIFDWSNSEKKIIISGPYGILPHPIDISFRNYAKMATTEPWKLHFDPPSTGMPSGQYILPAGIGITNNSGKLQGIISVGFNLNSLRHNINNAIGNEAISYVILDKNFNIIIHSFTEKLSPSEELALKSLINRKQDTPHNVKVKDYIFVLHYKLSKYPYSIVIGYDKTLLLNNTKSILMGRIFEILGFGFITISTLFIIRKNIVNPILDLSKIAYKIIKGHSNINIPEYKTYELSFLANQIKNIGIYTKTLEETQKELKLALAEQQKVKSELENLNISLEEKIKERTIQLEQALKIKTQILNNISHETRIPIHGANGIAQVLVDIWHNISDEERFRQVKIVAKNNARLAKFVGNILDLSKFTAGKMLFNFKRMDFIETLNDVIEEFNELYINGKDLKIVVEPNEFTSIIMNADELRISQLLRNILNNAIRYAPKGTISIKLLKTQLQNSDAILISISDEGIGIPVAELDKIFEPFVQSSFTSHAGSGTGLGLAICKEIVDNHKGKIWAENNQTGATFNIIIPVIAYNEIEPVKQQSNELNYVQPKTILFIDDEASTHDMFKLITMKYSHFNVIHAYGGYEAIEILKNQQNQISIILLDLMMPDLGGFDVLKIIKSDNRLQNIPILIQSGIDTSSPEVQKIINLFDNIDIINKPYNHKILIEYINNII